MKDRAVSPPGSHLSGLNPKSGLTSILYCGGEVRCHFLFGKTYGACRRRTLLSQLQGVTRIIEPRGLQLQDLLCIEFDLRKELRVAMPVPTSTPESQVVAQAVLTGRTTTQRIERPDRLPRVLQRCESLKFRSHKATISAPPLRSILGVISSTSTRVRARVASFPSASRETKPHMDAPTSTGRSPSTSITRRKSFGIV
jgi:hypothetical protein